MWISVLEKGHGYCVVNIKVREPQPPDYQPGFSFRLEELQRGLFSPPFPPSLRFLGLVKVVVFNIYFFIKHVCVCVHAVSALKCCCGDYSLAHGSSRCSGSGTAGDVLPHGGSPASR